MTPTETTAVLRLFNLTSLSEATRENWPWWGVCTKLGCRNGCISPTQCMAGARMPNFPTDPAAAVRLAEEMGSRLVGGLGLRPPREDDCEWLATPHQWAPNVVGAPTLGATLLAALVASTEEIGDGE